MPIGRMRIGMISTKNNLLFQVPVNITGAFFPVDPFQNHPSKFSIFCNLTIYVL
jgi:hypothetical protein